MFLKWEILKIQEVLWKWEIFLIFFVQGGEWFSKSDSMSLKKKWGQSCSATQVGLVVGVFVPNDSRLGDWCVVFFWVGDDCLTFFKSGVPTSPLKRHGIYKPPLKLDVFFGCFQRMTCNSEAKSVEEHIYHITILMFRKEVEPLLVPLGPKKPIQRRQCLNIYPPWN